MRCISSEASSASSRGCQPRHEPDRKCVLNRRNRSVLSVCLGLSHGSDENKAAKVSHGEVKGRAAHLDGLAVFDTERTSEIEIC